MVNALTIYFENHQRGMRSLVQHRFQLLMALVQ